MAVAQSVPLGLSRVPSCPEAREHPAGPSAQERPPGVTRTAVCPVRLHSISLFEFSRRDVAPTFILRGSGLEALPERGCAPSPGTMAAPAVPGHPLGPTRFQPCFLGLWTLVVRARCLVTDSAPSC